MGFEYNYIDPDAVDRVELRSDDSSDYQQYKKELYGVDEGIPEERQKLLDNPRCDVFERVATILLNSDCKQLLKNTLALPVNLPDYVENADELKEAILLDGMYTNVDPVIGDTKPEIRGECRHSKNDEYRPGDDTAMCCWYCSSDDTRKPAKFMADDEPSNQCSRYVMNGYNLKEAIADHLEVVGSGVLVNHFNDSNLSPHEIRKGLSRADEKRSQAINLAFGVAFSDEDYYYQRAEALLRDIDSDVAEDSGPGAGGREFEYEAVRKLDNQFTLRDETVFKIYFDENAPAVRWQDFVSDPSEPTFKEADAIIEGEIGPIVVDFFTQRNTREKQRQVRNYAELYEIATGKSAKAWGITDTVHAELIELDTITGSSGPDTEKSQAGLSDFL